MRVSIVMSTYNGEKYIFEQLESLKKQTRPADEVIISDDCSSDSTNEIIDKYIKDNNLKNWIHYKNAQNKGWKKNFMNAIELSTGDLIFTCDQDDIWFKHKLEQMEQIMINNDKINLLISDYKLEPNEVFNKISEEKIVKHILDKKFMFIYGPGCAFCFRRSFFDSAKTMWYEDYPHDAVLWRAAAITDSLYFYKQPLFYYRRHAETATGHDKKTAENKITAMGYYDKAVKSLEKYAIENNVDNIAYKQQLINNEKNWIYHRIKWLKNKEILSYIKLLRYIGYYYNFKSYVADFIMAFNKKDIRNGY